MQQYQEQIETVLFATVIVLLVWAIARGGAVNLASPNQLPAGRTWEKATAKQDAPLPVAAARGNDAIASDLLDVLYETAKRRLDENKPEFVSAGSPKMMKQEPIEHQINPVIPTDLTGDEPLLDLQQE